MGIETYFEFGALELKQYQQKMAQLNKREQSVIKVDEEQKTRLKIKKKLYKTIGFID